MKRTKRKTFSAHGILRFCNLGVASLLVWDLVTADLSAHPYINRLTLVLGLALCLQTYIVLRLQQRHPDPFVLVMTYLLTFFYSLRLFTLVHYPFSDVFPRIVYLPQDSNFALFFMLVANGCMYAGFHFVKLDPQIEPTSPPERSKLRFMMALFVLSVLFGPFIRMELPTAIAGPLTFLFNSFLMPNLILLVMAAYVVVHRKQLPKSYAGAVVAGAVYLCVLQTLGFSRSGLLTILDNSIILFVALVPMIRIQRKLVYFGFALLPVALMLAFTLYTISTTSRLMKGFSGTTLSEQIELIQTSQRAVNDEGLVDQNAARALARAGYFDYSAELIANQERYSEFITLGNYARSVVDSVFTPGFDVFDQPRVSNLLKYAGTSVNQFSRKQEAAGYHSDALGLYGEVYNLFGFLGSLPVLFCIAYVLKRVYRGSGRALTVAEGCKRVFIVAIFFRMFNSFGFDWVLMDAVTLGAVMAVGAGILSPRARRFGRRRPSLVVENSQLAPTAR